MNLPGGKNIVELHDSVVGHAADADLDRLMWAARHGDDAEIARIAAKVGQELPPDTVRHDDAFCLTVSDVVAYAGALRELYLRGGYGPERIPECVLRDLRYQPVIGAAAGHLRRGFPDAALAAVLVHERYAGKAAEEALALLAVQVLGDEIALVPVVRPYADTFATMPEYTRIVARFGDGLAAGGLFRGQGSTDRFNGGPMNERVADLHQAWIPVRSDGPEHRDFIAGALAGLAGEDGTLAPGTTLDAVVDAIVRAGRGA